MFNYSDRVIVTNEGHDKNKTGVITEIYPAPLMNHETVYMIKYDNSNNKGMFTHSELKRA